MEEVPGEEICAVVPSTTKITEPCAGNVRRYVDNWKEITKNDFILNIGSQGYKFLFNSASLQNDSIIFRCKSADQRKNCYNV